VSKIQVIRKKALDYVRDQDWANAIKEYRRLVDLDQSNPNLHNELADLFLKTNQKSEAYDAFIRACDEYVHVGLFNNAVAVCKKVLRVLPARYEALAKLGFIRSRQGLTKEAESYYQQFLEKAAGNAFTAEVFQKLARPMVDDMSDSPAMLEAIAHAFLGYVLKEDAADVYVKMVAVCTKNGDSAGAARARAEVEKLGMSIKLVTPTDPAGASDRTVITEENLWTKSHTAGERIEVDTGSSKTTPTGSPAAPAPQPAGAAPGGPSERDLYLLRLARGSAEPRKVVEPVAAATETVAPTPPPAAEPVVPTPAFVAEATAPAPAAPAETVVATATTTATTEPSPPIAAAEAPTTPATATMEKQPDVTPAREPSRATPGANGSGVHVSALIDDDGLTDGSETDYRSHYDLGMAYIEMDLHTEAIREYQLAAKSPQFQVKCLEMIGLCFIKQSQPQLAIRQLSKGLSLIGADTEESLGIKYNLGLAHEMTGDLANARTYFEDVYVVDVTFRDVAEKVRRLTGSS